MLRLIRMLTLMVCSRASKILLRDEDFLPHWMSQVWPAIKDLTVLDLSLPGTHDTMTYDLSTTFADGGMDDAAIAALLHDLGHLIKDAGSFVRTQAQTQHLNITEQLDNGIRFLDFRVMLTGGDWRSLHCVQSNGKALDYLQQVRTWLNDHPTELVVLWMSKHGNACAKGKDAYPGVSIDAKQTFWKEVEHLFGQLLVDDKSPVNTTSLGALLASGQRLVLYASDYVEFTGASTKAVDGCLVHTHGPLNLYDEEAAFPETVKILKDMPKTIESNKQVNKFELLSFADAVDTGPTEDLVKLNFDPVVRIMEARKDCASAYKIPNFTTAAWCPPTLLDIGQLSNYYNQVIIDAALQHGWGLPNAIYIDAVDVGGTLRVGPRLLSASPRDPPTCVVFKYTSCSDHQPTCDDGYAADGTKVHFDAYDSDGTEHTVCGWAWENHYRCCRQEPAAQDTARYAYVDSLVLHSIQVGCGRNASIPECNALRQALKTRRSRFPLTRWDDFMTGRLDSWPPLPTENDAHNSVPLLV